MRREFLVLIPAGLFSMPLGPRPVQTEVNVMRILLRGSHGRVHLMWKMLANARAFLLRTAGLTVTRTRWKRAGVIAGNKSSTAAAGVLGTPGPRSVAGFICPGAAGAAHWHQVGRIIRSPHRLVSGECPSTHSGDVSRVYAAWRKILLIFLCVSRL